MDDRRALKRTRVLRSAKIIVPRRSPVIHCTVQNITSAGACLKVANTYGVPQTFELTFEHGRTRRSCRVVWRTHDKLGVAFQGEETIHDAEAPPHEASPPLSPAAPTTDAATGEGTEAPAATAPNGDSKTG